MSLPHRTRHRFAAAVATACAGLALASAAEAVDLRDWGRKFPASERFVVLAQFNNQAVLDKETQLVWQRTPFQSLLPYRNSAVDSCTDRSNGGRLGWRLPSLHELASLVDPSAAPGSLALPAGHPFIAVPLGVYGEYWTATLSNDPTIGYLVRFKGPGFVLKKAIANPAYMWCVRAGGPISEY
jgi:hypothetical protein